MRIRNHSRRAASAAVILFSFALAALACAAGVAVYNVANVKQEIVGTWVGGVLGINHEPETLSFKADGSAAMTQPPYFRGGEVTNATGTYTIMGDTLTTTFHMPADMVQYTTATKETKIIHTGQTEDQTTEYEFHVSGDKLTLVHNTPAFDDETVRISPSGKRLSSLHPAHQDIYDYKRQISH